MYSKIKCELSFDASIFKYQNINTNVSNTTPRKSNQTKLQNIIEFRYIYFN